MTSTPSKLQSTPDGAQVKRSKPDYNDTITILVGTEEQEFKIHKTTLCDRSPYFKAACSTRWHEGQAGVVKLPDHEPLVFEIYAHWAYTGELDTRLVLTGTSGGPRSYEALIYTWVLAHYLGSLELYNIAIDQMLDVYDCDADGYIFPAATHLMVIYDHSPEDSGIRRLVLDMAFRLGTGLFDSQVESWPAQYQTDLLRKFVSGQTRQDMNPLTKDRCEYHEHEEGAANCA